MMKSVIMMMMFIDKDISTCPFILTTWSKFSFMWACKMCTMRLLFVISNICQFVTTCSSPLGITRGIIQFEFWQFWSTWSSVWMNSKQDFPSNSGWKDGFWTTNRWFVLEQESWLIIIIVNYRRVSHKVDHTVIDESELAVHGVSESKILASGWKQLNWWFQGD